MAPRINGTVHTFVEHGLYDGLFLMRDDETGTYWDHLTGEAVYGPQVGTKLEIGNLLQTRAGQISRSEPEAVIALSERPRRRDAEMGLDGLLSRVGGRLSRLFGRTVDEEDDRRPTMDIGMGVWQGTSARYYGYEEVVAEGRFVLDAFQGRSVLVYLDPGARVLSAYYVNAERASWEGDVLRLSNGQYIEGSVLYDADGGRTEPDRPLQIFTRWYGFALTFPDTEIYGEPR